jgi:hypothetical protein
MVRSAFELLDNSLARKERPDTTCVRVQLGAMDGKFFAGVLEADAVGSKLDLCKTNPPRLVQIV